RLALEKEMLGLYVSDHPLMGLESALKRKAGDAIADLGDMEDGQMITAGGVVTGLQRKWTRKGDLMAVFTLEDLTDSVEAMVFPRTFGDYGHLLEDDRIVVVRGRLDNREESPKLMVQSIDVFEADLVGSAPPLRLQVRPDQLSDALIRKLRAILVDHPGDAPVYIHLSEASAVRLADQYCVDTSNGLVPDLRVLLGEHAVVV
ncbi:MAG: DNA polymerase III subunit alpha, partial [Acidimicrobiia bacterium]|nr:DNA polymerase III subunit alpha [Acidimicrobiia bacterium]